MRTTSFSLAAATGAAALACAAAAGTGQVIYSNISGHPTADVPGVPGEHFRSTAAPFLTLYGSPDGTWWIFKAFSDNADADANELIIVGSGASGTTVAKEGDPAPLAGLTYGFLDSDCGINDSGRWVFGNRLSGGSTADDEILFAFDGVSIVSAVREGDPAPGLADPLGAGNELFGNSLNSAHVLADGTVGFRADLIQNIDTDFRSALYHGSAVVVQEGLAVDTAPGGDVYDSFAALSGNTFSSSADGSSWIVEADVLAGLGSTEAVVVTGSIQVRDGDLLPGLGSAVDSVTLVDMAGNGDWFAAGGLADGGRWGVRNGAVVAATGLPVPGSPGESYGSAILALQGNSAGDWLVIAETDNADVQANQVVVLNGASVVMREGDPVLLPGAGPGGVFIDGFDAFDAVLSDSLELYAFVGLRDEGGLAAGDALIVIDLGAGCPWDLDGDRIVGINDLLDLLAGWGNPWSINDLLDLLAAWGPCA